MLARSTSIASATDDAPAKIPGHVAIIMDGNGRWAKARGLPRPAGHKKGTDALHAVLDACPGLGIRYLTLYAFSSENWGRPQAEVSDLMELLRFYLRREIKNLHEKGVRLRVIGDKSRLDNDIRSDIEKAETLTQSNSVLNLTMALSYGSRQEMVRSIRKLAEAVQRGEIAPEAVDESLIGEQLDTSGLPDPDLLIRTGGEQRLSNFLLWQSAYTELFFTPVLWPDFGVEHLKEAVGEYARRERRYGTTSE